MARTLVSAASRLVSTPARESTKMTKPGAHIRDIFANDSSTYSPSVSAGAPLELCK